MAQMPPHLQYVAAPQQGQKQQPKEPRYRFRWGILLAPLAIFIVLYLMNGAEASFSFGDVMNLLGVDDQDRYVRLFTLGCICVAIAAILRLHRNRKKGS